MENHTTTRSVFSVQRPLNAFQNLKFDVRQLRFAVAAADFGSFRQAANALGIRQSTLSRSIGQLEDFIGIVVFDRSSGA